MLEAIVQNTEMGKNTLEQMIPMAQDGFFKAELLREKNVYHALNAEAHKCMAACGSKAKGQSKFAKANTRMGVSMKTMNDKSTRNLAQMLVQGGQQGVVDCVESQRDYTGATPGVKDLCMRLQEFQQESVDKMTGFL